MPVRLNGSTSGYTELSAPAVAGNNSIALPTGNGSAYQILRNGATAGSLEYVDNLVLGTAQNSTSGTSIDFTGIPSWVKRVTVMFNGVSLSGSSSILIQLGNSGGVETTGYVGQIVYVNGGAAGNLAFSSGVNLYGTGATAAILNSGAIVFTNVSGNIWVFQGAVASEANSTNNFVAGRKTTSGTLDRVRITTVNGTDTFDAGSINILYE
jgi:hypothetical protein